jgi:hypothetical protein
MRTKILACLIVVFAVVVLAAFLILALIAAPRL